jgi:predicted PurR-regulated permease PerM
MLSFDRFRSSTRARVDIMANLLIRNLDEVLRDRLQGRAQAKHRSLSEEAQETLRIAAGGPPLKPVPKTAVPDAAKAMTLFVMVVAVLYFGRTVLIPVTIALLLTFLLTPLVGLFRRAHLGRVPSVLLSVTLALGVVLAIGGVIGSQIAALSTDLPQYSAAIEAKISTVNNYTIGRLSHLADRIQPRWTIASRHNAAVQPTQAPSSPPPATAPTAEPRFAATPWELTKQYMSPVLSPFASLGIVFVVTLFALLQREDLRDRLIRVLGSRDIHRTTVAMDDAGRRLARYFLTQLSINTAFGIVIGVGLLVIGLPYPVLWGILAALLRFVPYFGSAISALLPIALAAAIEPGWSMALATAAFYLVAESLTGQVVEPMMYGHSTGISPFSVVVSALFWSWLWGPVGLILSTPLTLCVVVLGRHVKRLELLDVMLGDTPALTPVESFYQRMLADDPDEALDQAELLLKSRSLAAYYDEVALKGMQLAVNDAARGVLTPEQLESMKDTIQVLVCSLETQMEKPASESKTDAGAVEPTADESSPKDRDESQIVIPAPYDLPEAWRAPSAVLSIEGRGPLDGPASAILVQLLRRQGIGSRLVRYGEVSRDGIQTLDVTAVAMVCVSYLDISGSTAQLRYLLQRLRRRLPAGTPILVGLWTEAEPTLKNADIRAAIGADYFVSSFEDGVNACLAVAQRCGENMSSS